MIYIASVVFPIISIICGIVSLGALIKFVIEIQREIRESK